ncbi:hypothetical protein JHK85_008765 [Glycine max]|nr:hypothetical protein JHK85_008765 [Glycine max]
MVADQWSSSIFEMGNTEVTAAVYGPREVRCEYSLANFSTGDRMRKSKEDSAGGADVTLGILPKLDKVTLLQICRSILSAFVRFHFLREFSPVCIYLQTILFLAYAVD